MYQIFLAGEKRGFRHQKFDFLSKFYFSFFRHAEIHRKFGGAQKIEKKIGLHRPYFDIFVSSGT